MKIYQNLMRPPIYNYQYIYQRIYQYLQKYQLIQFMKRGLCTLQTPKTPKHYVYIYKFLILVKTPEALII